MSERTEELHKALQATIDSTAVTYKRLGNSGLKVSLPILGAMSFGSKEWQPWVVDDEQKVMELLKGAWDMGLNTWDTANIYSNGVSEEMIGRAIKKLDIPRRKLVILTKCFATVGEDPSIRSQKFPKMNDTRDYVNQGGLSRAAIFNAVELSLKRLDTDYIDLLQIHRFDKNTPVEETMKALHDLVQSGKVRYIGASSMWAYQLAQMQFAAERNGWTKFVSMQNHYSLCYREEEREMNKFCHETGVGLIPWGPLYSGLLARPLGSDATARESNSPKDLKDAEKEIIKRVQELAEKKGWKMSQVALAWIVQKNTIPIVGFSSVDRIKESCEVNGKELTEEEIKHLEEPYVPRAVVGHS